MEKKTTTKTAKKVTTKKITKEVTNEDKILGNPIVEEVKQFVSYEDKDINYKVTNLKLNNGSIIVNGNSIEAFIGSKNIEARHKLQDGAKEVVTVDTKGNEAYKIEVV